MVFAAFVNFLGYQDPLYVARFAGEWRTIAKFLREERGYRTARACLNRAKQCTEMRLFFGFGRLVARVKVCGSEGYPRVAVVTSPKPLSESVKLIFDRKLPLVVDFRIGV